MNVNELKKRKFSVTFSVDFNKKKELDELAQNLGMNRSAVISLALAEFKKNHKELLNK